MARSPKLEVTWETPVGSLRVHEASGKALQAASRDLASFYNDPHNAALLSNTVRFTPAEVVRLWRDATADGGRPFLLSRDGVVVGDADFRNAREGGAELAILVGPRDQQGKGLGRRFATMVLAVGFARLGLERVFVAIRPANAASLRLFAGAGFLRDDSPAGRSYAEDDDDICLVLPRDVFLSRHAPFLGAIAGLSTT